MQWDTTARLFPDVEVQAEEVAVGQWRDRRQCCGCAISWGEYRDICEGIGRNSAQRIGAEAVCPGGRTIRVLNGDVES